MAVTIGLVMVLAAALLVSAATDEPSKIVHASTTVNARQRNVWHTLADFDAYADWNPTIVSIRGRLEKGSTLALRVRDGDGHLETREVRVLDLKAPRKLRWQDRLLLPGVRDRELTIHVQRLSSRHIVVTADERYEGLLAQLADTDDEELGLQRMLDALRTRAEGYES